MVNLLAKEQGTEKAAYPFSVTEVPGHGDKASADI